MISRELLFSLSDEEKSILIFIFNERYGQELWTLECLTACRLSSLKEKLKEYAPRILEEHKSLYSELCKKFDVNVVQD